MSDATRCSIDGCAKPRKVRGWCRMHYMRWVRHGDPLGLSYVRVDGPAPARFWAKVDKTDDCWLWTAVLNPGGYGQFWDGERLTSAHRWSYEHHVGPIPKGLQLDHLCRVRRCVRPDHLEPVTQRENGLRGHSLNAENARKTHCKRGHEFTPENTITRPDAPGHRQCRECKRQADRRRSRGNKEVTL